MIYIICWNPKYINQHELINLRDKMKRIKGVDEVLDITHVDDSMAPFYCINTDDSQLGIYLKEIPQKK